ncbi:MAG: DUF2815 family protein [Rhizobium sp.]|nr:MAG: DUF2815 family protein [Rhizobium sp.]
MAKNPPCLALTPPAKLLIFDPLTEKKPFIDPKTKKEKGDPKYRATFIIPKSANMDQIKAQLAAAARAKNASIPYEQWKKPVKDGNKLIERAVAKGKAEGSLAYYKDCWVVECKSEFKPDLSIARGGKAEPVPDEAAGQVFYSGAQVIGELNFVAHEIEGEDNNGDPIVSRYISAYHNFVLKVGEGERFGRKSRDEVFKGVMGGTSAENPMAGKDEDEDF